jgi:LDH2 family malate/lactate/ureidoglycolate dehydrogenase
MGREATDSTFIPQEFGGWLLVWNIGQFGEPATFRRRVTEMCQQIRNAQTMKGCAQVQMPGDRAWRVYEEAEHAGVVEVNEDDFQELSSFSTK